MATRLKVTYAEGRQPTGAAAPVVTVLATPRAQVETERHFTGLAEAKQIETSYYLAWASLKWAGREDRDFEAWLDAVTDVEEAAKEVVDPTPASPPPPTSSV